MGVHDLNFGLHICDAFGFKRPGVTHERGQDTVCASHGVRAVEDLRTHYIHRMLRWGLDKQLHRQAYKLQEE